MASRVMPSPRRAERGSWAKRELFPANVGRRSAFFSEKDPRPLHCLQQIDFGVSFDGHADHIEVRRKISREAAAPDHLLRLQAPVRATGAHDMFESVRHFVD